MKNKLTAAYLIAILSCVMLIVCLFKIASLSSEMESINRTLSNQLNSINNNISLLYNNIDSKLEENASIIASSDWSYGKVNTDDLTVAVNVRVAPKDFTSTTTASVTVGDNEYPLEEQNGEFSSDIDISLFGETVIGRVIFRDGDISRAETLDWPLFPLHSCLPNITATFGGRSRGSSSDKAPNTYTVETNGDIHIDIGTVKTGEKYIPESISLVRILDGSEIERTDITNSLTSSRSYSETISGGLFSSTEAAIAVPDYPEGHDEVRTSGFYPFNEEIDIPYGSTLDIIVEVIGSDSLTYRTIVARYVITESGKWSDESGSITTVEPCILRDGIIIHNPAPTIYK